MMNQPNEGEKFTRVFTTDGLLDLPITDKDDASSIGNHWNAVKNYLNTGETWELELLEGVSIRVGTD
jgi:hypothetical protein